MGVLKRAFLFNGFSLMVSLLPMAAFCGAGVIAFVERSNLGKENENHRK
jgi:hypothetical protein